MRYFFLSLLLLLYSLSAISQSQITLNGKILDSLSNEPLSFAYVTVEGVALGTVTNGEGEFTINLSQIHEDKNLLFSYLGYKRKSHSIRNLLKQENLIIYLNEDVTKLNEVVIKPRKKINHNTKTMVLNVFNNFCSINNFLA